MDGYKQIVNKGPSQVVLHRPALQKPGDGLVPPGDLPFSERAVDMGLHRAHGDIEHVADLPGPGGSPRPLPKDIVTAVEKKQMLLFNPGALRRPRGRETA